MTAAQTHLDRGPVALFAGATAGLGEAILRAYAAEHPTARIYFVGRNAAAAARIEADVRRARADAAASGRSDGEGVRGSGDVVFIKMDLSLISNGRAVRDAFVTREGEEARLGFLCMSHGYLTVRPRTGTLDYHFHSARFTRSLRGRADTPFHSIAQNTLKLWD
jgi:NAD(P)-dependent dehydrogenase (short-subunit alcohol dehydrogenase family)